MSTETTVRVGQMPGRINEFAATKETTFAQLLELAELSPNGFDVKADGVKVNDILNSPIGNTQLVILAQQVKGNANGTIRIGQMPGRIEEYAIAEGTTVAQALELASLSASGFDVKVDGVKASDLNAVLSSSANLIILAQQVKGNIGTTATQETYGTKSVRVGKMPGRIEEYAVSVGDSVASVIETAGLDVAGFDVKVDGVKVDPATATINADTKLILLAQQVKGNN